jgi:hypothetical protein
MEAGQQSQSVKLVTGRVVGYPEIISERHLLTGESEFF